MSFANNQQKYRYFLPTSNPFLYQSNNSGRNRNSIINVDSFLNNGNNSTKKRIRDLHHDKENYDKSNLPSPKSTLDNYSLFKLKKKMRNKGSRIISSKRIYFEDSDSCSQKNQIFFPLFEDSQIYCGNPYNEHCINMTNDEDVKSDDDLITKGSIYLINEIKYGIVAFSQKIKGF